jgi:hypothetical protein
MILLLFIVYGYLFYFGGNWKNRVKRGDFDMVLEEDLDMDLEEKWTCFHIGLNRRTKSPRVRDLKMRIR